MFITSAVESVDDDVLVKLRKGHTRADFVRAVELCRDAGVTLAPPRSAETRKADALALLATPAIDVWVATASADGQAHLVPLSLCWTGERAVIATDPGSVTVRNLERAGSGRLAGLVRIRP